MVDQRRGAVVEVEPLPVVGGAGEGPQAVGRDVDVAGPADREVVDVDARAQGRCSRGRVDLRFDALQDRVAGKGLVVVVRGEQTERVVPELVVRAVGVGKERVGGDRVGVVAELGEPLGRVAKSVVPNRPNFAAEPAV